MLNKQYLGPLDYPSSCLKNVGLFLNNVLGCFQILQTFCNTTIFNSVTISKTVKKLLASKYFFTQGICCDMKNQVQHLAGNRLFLLHTFTLVPNTVPDPFTARPQPCPQVELVVWAQLTPSSEGEVEEIPSFSPCPSPTAHRIQHSIQVARLSCPVY